MAITDNDEVTETPAAHVPLAIPGLVAPILFGLLGAWWASNKASKLGASNTKRYWIAAAISTGVVMLASILVPLLLVAALAASIGGTTTSNVLDDPAVRAPLSGNSGNIPVATRVAGGAQPEGVTNDPSTTSMYGNHPAKDDLTGPTGAVVWTIKDRAWCFTGQNVACLDQLYNTHGPSYNRDVALVSAGNRSNTAANWDATDIVITKQDADHFTANFMPVNPAPSEVESGRLVGTYTWSTSLGVWMIDELVPFH